MDNQYVMRATMDFLEYYIHSALIGESENSIDLYVERLKSYNSVLIADITYHFVESMSNCVYIVIQCHNEELLRHKLLYSEPKFKIPVGHMYIAKGNQLVHAVP